MAEEKKGDIYMKKGDEISKKAWSALTDHAINVYST